MHSATLLHGRATVSTAAKRLGAVAAVNADYFWQSGDPLGLLVSDGELKSEPYPGRTVFAMGSDGGYLFGRPLLEASVTPEGGASRSLSGLNHLRGKNEIVAYTRAYSESTHTSAEGTEVVVCINRTPRPGEPVSGMVKEILAGRGNTPLEKDILILSGSGAGAKWLEENLKPGANLSILFSLKSDDGRDWNSISEAVGGGPRLVKDGAVVNTAKEEGFKPDVSAGTAPRTAVGVTSDGKIIIATVDGRQPQSKGMTLEELAKFMQSRGYIQAMNLDGGGSTTLATAHGILNSPSDGKERPVADAIAVLGAPLKGEPGAEIKIAAPSRPVEAGSTCRLLLVNPATGEPAIESCARDAVWYVENGGGFVDQSGSFIARTARTYTLAARYRDKVATQQIDVVAGPPASMTPLLEEVSLENPYTSRVSATVQDSYKNPVKDAKVFIKVSGGAAEQGEMVTDSRGAASIMITWDSAFTEKYEVEVSCGGLRKSIPGPARKPVRAEPEAPANIDKEP
jgi:hypothetical protein